MIIAFISKDCDFLAGHSADLFKSLFILMHLVKLNQFEMFVSARKYPYCDICYFCLNQFWMSLTISGSLAAFPVPTMFSVALIFSLDIQWYQISKLHISQFFQNKATYLNFTPKRIQSGITEVSNQVG